MELRNVLRIARWEVTKNAGGVDRRTILVGVGAIALFGLLLPVVAGSGGAGLDDNLYSIGGDQESRYHEVATAPEGEPFRAVPEQSRDRPDLLARGEELDMSGTEKGRAAYREFRSSVRSYNIRRLTEDGDNSSAAFPVIVTLQYRQQDTGTFATQAGTDEESGTGGQSGSGDTGGNGGQGPGGGGLGGGDGTIDPGSGGGLSGIAGPLSDQKIQGSPANISPPFPFQSLVLAFIFVIPLNFLIQAYGSTILSERINRRGELLLVSPVSRYDIIAGKTLPYFLGGLLVESLIAIGVFGLIQQDIGGFVSIFAVLPLVLLFLSTTFLGAMFARSFKELTFVTVTITVSLTSYAFVPAIFTSVENIALISPLTIVVRTLQNDPVSPGGFLFSITPPLLAALMFFGLGAGLYREEDMFAQRSMPGRVLDALVNPIPRPDAIGPLTAMVRVIVPAPVRRLIVRLGSLVPVKIERFDQYLAVGTLTGFLIPFVFIAQLLAIALLFALGNEISIPILLVIVVITEEITKSLHIYAGYRHGRFDGSFRGALALGTASGTGFFLGEKIALLGQFVGLNRLPEAQAGLSVIPGRDALPLPILLFVLFLFLLAPLLLHVVTATVSTLGARRGKQSYIGALVAAMLIHFAYNFTVVIIFGVL